EIQRTARELLAERSRPERVREHAEAGRTDEALWRELCGLGWPGIAIAEQYGGQGLGPIELSILCEELGSALAPVAFLPTLRAGAPEQLEAWLAALASGEATGALGVADGGTAELAIGGPDAAVLVLLDEERSARLLTPEQADVSPAASIDPTRSAARVSAAAD